MAKSKAWCDIKDITGKTRFLFPFSFRDKTNDNTVFPLYLGVKPLMPVASLPSASVSTLFHVEG